MIAKYLKRMLVSAAIAGLTIALAYPAFAQTTYKTETSVNVGQPSSTQLSRDEINQQEAHDELEENTHHEQIDEGLDSQARADAISHDLRIKQLEAAQTPYKPQHIADENEQYADEKKDNAQKKAIEAQRHAQALARIEAAAQALLSGAASALGNALNGGGGSASNPSSGGGSPGNRAYPGGAPGGVPNNPALGGSGAPAGNPNSGGSTASNPNGGGSSSNPNGGGGPSNNPNAGGGSPGSPRLAGGASSNPNNGGNSSGNPNAGGGSPNNPNSGSASASNPNAGNSPSNPSARNSSPNNPYRGSASASNPNNGGGGSASNPNAGRGSPSNPRLTGNASSNANGAPNSSSNPNAGNSSPNNPYRGGASASNPNSSGGSPSNPNAGGGTANNPRLTGNASSNANNSSASSSGPGAGQRPLDFLTKTLNGFVDQFQNGGQNLQNASNAMQAVGDTFKKQWTEPYGGINQVAAMVAFHGLGGAIEALAPAIKSIAGEAGTAAPGILARARAAAPGIAARAKAYVAKLFGSTESSPPLNGAVNAAGENGANALNAGENATSGALKGSANAAGENATNAAKTGGAGATVPAETSPGGVGENPASSAEPPAGELGSPQNPLTDAAVSKDWQNLAGKVVQVGDKTFDLGANRGQGVYGAVYDIKNTPGSLLKVVRNDVRKGIDQGAKSIQGQLAGTDLLQKAGIATPAIENVSSGGTNALVTQDIKQAFNRGFVPNLSKPLNGAQRAAVQRMFNQLGDKGLVWEDGGLRNVFFYTSPNGSLSAGIMDSDRLFPVSQIGAQSSDVQGYLMQKTYAALKADPEVDLRNITARNYMDALFKAYYPG